MAGTVVVQKYGGSSVADVARIKKVAQRVADTVAEGHRVVVVVSAMGDTTDSLLALAGEVSENPPRRELDMLLTAGERIAMALLSMALHDLGVDAISFTGSQSGIITNDAHAGAKIIEVRPYRIEDELERGRVVIVAGYQGVSYRREVTTLGRGGSDTTAVALAAALRAEHCEICSDVDGVMTGDPRVVDDPKRLAEITPEEMLALAEGGARVLAETAVAYAREQGIVIWARASSSQAGAGDDGTRVRLAGPETPATVVAVARRKVGLVRAAVAGAEAVAALEAALAGNRCRALASHWGGPGTEAVLLVATGDLLDRAGAEAAARAAGATALDLDLEGVSAAGAGADDPGVAAALVAACAAEGARICHLERTRLRVTVVVDPAAGEAVERRVHRALGGGEGRQSEGAGLPSGG